jgi:hypothetical protein
MLPFLGDVVNFFRIASLTEEQVPCSVHGQRGGGGCRTHSISSSNSNSSTSSSNGDFTLVEVEPEADSIDTSASEEGGADAIMSALSTTP